MLEGDSAQAVIQNLKDAGCDLETTERSLALEQAGQTREQLKLLSVHRKRLLDKVHEEERRIDCLDYLVYQVKREKRTTETSRGGK